MKLLIALTSVDQVELVELSCDAASFVVMLWNPCDKTDGCLGIVSSYK